METPLNASAPSVGTLFSTHTFLVPAYQREYAWGADQVVEFWTDLKNGMREGSYFLGLAILTEEEEGRSHVVDGQQRLLTITLLAGALYQQALAAGRRALADRLEATFLKSIDFSTDEMEPRVVLSAERDNLTLQELIQGTGLTSDERQLPEDSLSPRLIEAHNLLRGLLSDDLEDESFKKLGAWAEFLTNRVYLAVFVHPNPASAFRVFEVINTRGRELTLADLLKSFILSESTQGDRPARYANWQRLVSDFEPYGSGVFVQFIRHVVTLTAGYILPRDLYDYISGRPSVATRSRRPVMTAHELVDSLNRWAPLYLQIVDPTLEGPADSDWLRVFSSLDQLGVVSVRPLVMAITTASAPTAGLDELLRLVLRRIVVGNLGTGAVERRFSEAASVIMRNGSWREAMSDLSDLNPDSEDFNEQLRKRSLNKGTLTFVRRSLVQGTITPVQEGVLHLVRPRFAYDWLEFPDDDFTYWGSTLGNTLLASVERRPSGSATWSGVKLNLLPEALPGDPLRDYEGREWSADVVAEVGRGLAVEATNIWYP